MGKLIFISGGVSSGKSDFAEKLCSEFGGKTLYIATSIPFDEEMKAKKKKHIDRRATKNWDTLEEYSQLYKEVENIDKNYDTVLLDCITMMVSNLIFHNDYDFDAANIEAAEKKSEKVIEEACKLIDNIKKTELNFLVVTNEIGLGGISENRLTRYFAELCGKVNQMFAQASDDAYFVVSGIPIKIKGN